ncbi:MAG TPA: YebC/PmpR family DNA-binding transcriptional regulator [Candidatus Gallibacteroides avistercoris]|uniref:Probable transcriptional regulatory protein IAB03_10080 n=1 Tax=Candidatus Gallibacteroides avistercoris TaxID=2840833 RepID=A0A9D1SDZ8_9BACT|nr:YebC/PmpR family DNA-binding transcriptional regulator [Candidatus Gallibacteroides avistercoris]
MGRAFEYRKATKLKRWGNMARTFTRIGKQIAIAVKAGGPDAENNPHLRAIIATAKRENMPKDNIERAIKNAMGKDQKDYKEMNYEGYGPFGIAIYVETATDNTTRTVANVRSIFNKLGGSLGTSGSLDFIFTRKSMFTITPKEGVDMDELILELIDYGVEDEYDVDEEENEITLYGDPKSFSQIQKYLEDNGFEVKAAEFTRIPNDVKEVTDEQRATIDKIVERLEEDEDVQNVYHNMKPAEEE